MTENPQIPIPNSAKTLILSADDRAKGLDYLKMLANTGKDVEDPNEDVEYLIHIIADHAGSRNELLKALENAAKKEDAETRALYIQAELQNLRRQSRENENNAASLAKKEVLKAILPVVNNLEHALNCDASSASNDFHNGIHIIHEQLVGSLNNLGLNNEK